MKTLEQILDEIIQERKERIKALPITEGQTLLNGNDPLVKKYAQESMQKRITALNNEPAFGKLSFIMSQDFIDVFKKLEGFNLPEKSKQNLIIQLFMEIILIWEEVNNKFNEQLKVKP